MKKENLYPESIRILKVTECDSYYPEKREVILSSPYLIYVYKNLKTREEVLSFLKEGMELLQRRASENPDNKDMVYDAEVSVPQFRKYIESVTSGELSFDELCQMGLNVAVYALFEDGTLRLPAEDEDMARFTSIDDAVECIRRAAKTAYGIAAYTRPVLPDTFRNNPELLGATGLTEIAASKNKFSLLSLFINKILTTSEGLYAIGGMDKFLN